MVKLATRPELEMHEARVNSATPQAETVYQIEDLRVAYGDNEVLHGVSLPIEKIK